MSKISRIAVVGAGQMGGGIAQVLASCGYSTLLYDEYPDALDTCLKRLGKFLDRMVEKEEISDQDKVNILSRITKVKNLSEVANVDLVIEAIVEDTAAKTALFSELDRLCKPQAILASNTSSISITKIAASGKRPEQVIGMHFMNPVPLMALVEIIRGMQTSDETHQAILDLTEKLGKTPSVQHDYPGFVVNRILVPMINEGFFALMEGLATAEEIDTAMKLGTNQPMGPLELADLVGLDVCLAICKILHSQLGEDKYRPCPLLEKYVEAGWCGRKSGRGVYTY